MHTKCDVGHSMYSIHRLIHKCDTGHTSYTWHRCCYVRMYVYAHAFLSLSVGGDVLMPFGSIHIAKRYLRNTIIRLIFIGQGKKRVHTRGFVM